MPQNTKPSPVVEFLGEDAGAGGPFAILGLLYQIDSQEQIIRACNRRLHQVDRHRHRSTPDADEVRLAVHAAASQLLDPVLRAQLMLRWPEGKPMAVPKAWKPVRKAPSLTPAFIQSARLLIAASGGWNSTARKRLANFARTNRVTALELISALSTPKSLGQQVKQEVAKPAIDRVHLIDPPRNGSYEWIVISTLLCVVGGAVLAAVVLNPRSFLVEHEEIQQGQVKNRVEDPAVNSGEDNLLIVHERENISHYTAVAHELDQLVVRAQSHPAESIERFAIIYPQFVDSWLAFPTPALHRSSLHIAEFVRRVSESQTDQESFWSIFLCDQLDTNPTRSMIRSAVIDVVLSDPVLSTQAKARLISIRKRCSKGDPHPTQSITTALITIAGLEGVNVRADDLKWWKQWIQGVRAITSEDEEQRTRLVLSAMSARLRDQSPSNQSWNRSVIELVNTVSWREGVPSRYWLLSQFSDEAVNTSRLAALTSAIAIHSSAKQIDAQMVLNPSSTFLQRQELAQAYRQKWASGGSKSNSSLSTSSDEQYRELINELHIRISITPTQMDQEQATRASVELARLNTSAWQYSQGHQVLAEESLKNASDPLNVISKQGSVDLSINQRDTQWAQSAINVKEAAELSSLFAQLVQDNGPGVNSAYALIHIATLHANSDIRSLANTQILRYKDHASILLALDHAIGSTRISSRLEQLVMKVVDHPLPSRTESLWYRSAHQSLLSLLTTAIAQSGQSNLSALEQELRVVYFNRLEIQSGSVQSAKSALESARFLYGQLLYDIQTTDTQSENDTQRIEGIQALIAVRLKRAPSSMHQFLAYQRALCELHALRIERVIPGSSFPVGDVAAELESRLGQSHTVFEQIAQAERSIAQLWVIWFEGGAP